MTEKYTINWDTFSEHLKSMIKDLYQEGRFSDVTLVSDDQTQFKAHKFVLSACSPVFKKIIDSNPSQHSLIYLRGIHSYELEPILQFMYLGEGKFYQERLREFIKVAQDFELKEISYGVELQSEEAEESLEENILEEKNEEELIEETPIKAEKTTIQQRRRRTQISKKVEETKLPTEEKKARQIKTEISNVKKSTACPDCGTEYSSRTAMMLHFRSKHEGIKYPCDQCNYEGTTEGDRKRHIQSLHAGVKYPCTHCDYQAAQKYSLKTHFAAMHRERVLKCDICDYQTRWISCFNKHKKTHKAV